MRRALSRLWPASLAGRTALVLILGLMAVQALGLTIHAFDRLELQRIVQAREVTGRTFFLWRAMVNASPERRAAILAEVELPPGLSASVEAEPVVRPGMPPVPPREAARFRLDGPTPGWGPPRMRPREVLSAALPGGGIGVAIRLPDGPWLNLALRLPPTRPWHSDRFLIAFLAMSVAAAALTIWGVRRMTRPVRDLAAAAERLGRDVNAPALPEQGPREVATAAAAFNTMAGNIRRFVADRTQMLAAIGHDLRTPITRLRLRAEFMEDETQRRKMLADLEEMEAMIAATLAFARDDAAAEPAVPLDLAQLARTVLDEAADARPDLAERVTYDGPEHLVLPARPVALKRALANLVGNALAYGGAARLGLSRREAGVELRVEDDGPGIPAGELEAVFQPFRRLEGSRNRETGGTGLGLTIARSILRAHGGDVRLVNRPGGGLAAVAVLPG
ncbi:MAG: HAMP domain-containing protein [Acetobacteraceae bacterium]|nr:HAMP domain-containing protein [Acetobacteraceae bacterium]